MTDAQVPAVAKKPAPAVRAGGHLSTFVPQTMDELWRMAQWAAVGGMAPKSLTEGKDRDQATSAAAIAIMAGAELGLTPMMALRSYAVVNGRPSLWGDGLIAVVLKSPVYAPGSLKKGGDEKSGWCEAARTDGTVWKETFTMDQAKRAGLSTKKGPWQEYPDVMLQRRAISKCLNFLFADVLGGVVSADEAYEGSELIDVTPTEAPSPAEPPAPAEPADKTPPEDVNDDDSGVVTDPITFLADLEGQLAGADTKELVAEVWEFALPEAALSGDTQSLTEAFDLRKKRLAQIELAGVARTL